MQDVRVTVIAAETQQCVAFVLLLFFIFLYIEFYLTIF
jgi:hypothetical protein